MTLFLMVMLVSCGATFIGAASGGSTSVITLPCWLSFGFPLPTAVAADKTAATLWTAVASRNFLRGKQVDWKFLFGLAVCGSIGAVFGTRVTIGLDPEVFKPFVGGVILILVALSWWKQDFGVHKTEPSMGKVASSFIGLPLGFYEGILGSGNTLLSSFALCKSRGFDLVTSLGHSYLVAFVWCLAASIGYACQGHGSWTLTIPAIIGSVVGAQLGSKLGSRLGAKPIKILFSIAGTFFGTKLLLGL